VNSRASCVDGVLLLYSASGQTGGLGGAPATKQREAELTSMPGSAESCIVADRRVVVSVGGRRIFTFSGWSGRLGNGLLHANGPVMQTPPSTTIPRRATASASIRADPQNHSTGPAARGLFGGSAGQAVPGHTTGGQRGAATADSIVQPRRLRKAVART
jgi:hypothetical protein